MKTNQTRWEHLAVLSSFTSAIIVAVIGGLFTYSQNKSAARAHEIELSRQETIRQSEAATAAANKSRDQQLLELQTVSQFMPYLTSKDDVKHRVAITAISVLSNHQLAIELAKLNPSQGAREAVELIAANASTEQERRSARSALSQMGTVRIAEMKQAVAVSSSNYGAALDDVERQYQKVQEDELIERFDADGFDPSKCQPLMSDTERALRKGAFAVLDAYMDLLGALASRAPEAQLHAARIRLSKSLQTMAGQSTSGEGAPHPVAVAIQEIENLSETVTLDPRSLVVQMDPTIQRLCKLLSSEVQMLASVSNNQYGLQLVMRSQFIHSNEARLTPQEKDAAIRGLVELQRQRKAAEAKLNETSANLDKIARLHSQLTSEIASVADPQKTVQKFLARTGATR